MATQKPQTRGNLVIAFLTQVREEARHVTWPTREKAIRLTLMVIGVSLGVGIYLGGLDYLFTLIMGLII